MNLLEKVYWLGKMETPKLERRGERSWHFWQPGIEIKKDGMLGSAFGRGSTEQAAIEDYWHQITEGLGDNQCLVRNSWGSTYDDKDGVRVEYRWRGCRWEILDCFVYQYHTNGCTFTKLKVTDYDPYRT